MTRSFFLAQALQNALTEFRIKADPIRTAIKKAAKEAAAVEKPPSARAKGKAKAKARAGEAKPQ